MCCTTSNAQTSGDRMRRGVVFMCLDRGDANCRQRWRASVGRFIPTRKVDARSDDFNVASVGMSGTVDSFNGVGGKVPVRAGRGDTLGGYEVRGQSASGELGEVVDFRVVD